MSNKINGLQGLMATIKAHMDREGLSASEVERMCVRKGHVVTGIRGWVCEGSTRAPRVDQVLAVLDALGYDVVLQQTPAN
jgi:hypothetical protein